MINRFYIAGFFCLFLFSCKTDVVDSTQDSRPLENTENFQFFSLLESSSTGLDFSNQITETVSENIIVNDATYQGGGVGIIDINNDGLQDIYFAGNQVGDQLYLNKGNMQFENITATSGIENDNSWSTGVTVLDINSDGLQDVYVSKFFFDDKKRLANKLYINQGNNQFQEKAKEFNLADTGHSTMSNFFDMDNDGDLDLYVGNEPPSSSQGRRALGSKTDYQFTDRLYRNDNGKFTDVTKESNVTNYTYTLSVTASDLNNDGWIDLYIACDYEEPDILLINQKNGTFKNEIHTAMKHIGNFSMGTDIADINNDGHLDIYTVDMVAEDNYRQKTNMSGMNPEKFWNLASNGYHYQYMFNSLQLNNGNGSYSEIAQMSGISNTDWSWSPLFCDIDNDGLKDLLVTNGLYRDMRNKDFEKKKEKLVKSKKGKISPEELMNLINESPSVKIQNFIYKNNGDLTFEKRSDQWGFKEKGWSQGMALADFDNDGDLDVVMNNTNQPVSLYKNNSADSKINNYLNIKIKGPKSNQNGIGALIEIKTSVYNQKLTHTPYRGYMSTSQMLSHFGLGGETTAEVTVIFPGGKTWRKSNVQANQTLEVNYSDADQQSQSSKASPSLFTAINNSQISHKENTYDDYKREILIPYKLSSLGPVMDVADLNNDGNDDFYLGGSIGHSGKIYISDGKGNFTIAENGSFQTHNGFEDGAVAFIDVNRDGRKDLFVGSGGNEYGTNLEGFGDRIYLNGDNLDFSNGLVVDDSQISTGAVCSYDYDKDGINDIFIGGRQVPGQYGRSADSKIIKVSSTEISDATKEVGSIFNELGMVTDVHTADIDNDGTEELIVVGEWMPIQIFSFNGDQFVKESTPSLDKTNGMWNKILVEDIDGDGHLDIIAGNNGLNNKYLASQEKPFKLFVNDFDKNGSNDVYLGFNEDGKTFPVRGRQCSSEQMPFVAEKFETYDVFGKSTVEDVLEGKTEGMTTKEVYTFAHTIFYGDGKGGFTAAELPMPTQIAPVHGIVMYDFDGDGDQDLFTAGNFYDREVETTRSDAGTGNVLLNQGNRTWKSLSPTESGISATEDVRDARLLKVNGGKPILAIANNSSPMQFYRMR